MIAIDPTPETVAALYAGMERKQSALRRRLGTPLSLADKVLAGHLDDPEHGAFEAGQAQLRLRPDRVVFQDVLGQSALLQFMQTGRARVAIPTTIHCDHLIQARTGAAPDLAASLDESPGPRSTAAASGSRAPASSTRSCSRTTRSRAR